MDTASPRDRLLHIVAELLSAGGEVRPFSCDEQLSAVGLTSLDMVSLMFAIENAQFIATLAPAKASDALKRTLLGIDRPAKSLADAGDLDKLAKQYGYSNYGEGFFDVVRIAERLTTTGMTLGTVQYYAPEQAQGEIVSPAADVYALGIVMYEMLTGRTPFDGDTPVAVAMQHIQDAPVPPSELNPGIPQALEDIIMRCLEKIPEMRFRDGSQLARALETLGDLGRCSISAEVLR